MSQRLSSFVKFFRDENADEEERAIARANDALQWAQQPYHKVFMDWLEDQASTPIQVGLNHMDLVQTAVRANTLREVRKHIIHVVRVSQDAVGQSMENNNG